jgi:hypothetical protein
LAPDRAASAAPALFLPGRPSVMVGGAGARAGGVLRSRPYVDLTGATIWESKFRVTGATNGTWMVYR